MRLLTLIIFLVASAAFTAAAPVEQEEQSKCSQDFCGKCNGTSCKVAATNYKCSYGSCVASEGGDGAPCGTDDLIGGSFYCGYDAAGE